MKHKHIPIKQLNASRNKNNNMKIRKANICTCDGNIRVNEENVDVFIDRLIELKKKYS